MTIVDTLVTRYTLDPSGYLRGAKVVMSATARVGDFISNALNKVFSLTRSAGYAILGLAGTMVGLAAAASHQAMEMDAMMLGLSAVSGSAEEAQRQLVRLKEIAKLPGLGIEEALRGSINLQAAGFSANMAERALLAFGNALATVGKSKADLGGVILALTQIQAKGTVSMEEIRQLQERLPQIRQAMKAAFGTGSTEEIAKMGYDSESFILKIIEQFEKLPRVTSGAKVEFENFGDAMKYMAWQAGQAINRQLMPELNKLGNAIHHLVDSGVIDKAVTKFLSLFGIKGLGSALTTGLLYVIAVMEEMPLLALKVRNWFEDTFQRIRDNAKVAAIIIGAVFGFVWANRIVAAITIVIRAIMALRAAIISVGIAQVIMEAIATGGLSLAKATLGIAAGVAAAAGIMAIIERQFPSTQEPTSGPEEDISSFGGRVRRRVDELASDLEKADRRDRIGGIEGAINTAIETLTDIQKAKSDYKFGDPNTEYLQQIAKNTSNMSRMMDRQILGGGELGRIGVTPVELSGGTMRSDSGQLGRALEYWITRRAIELIRAAQQSRPIHSYA